MLLHRLINLKICMIFIFQISYWHPCILSCSCLSHCVVQLLNHFWLFVTPWTAACQVSLSITISQSLLKLMSIDSQMRSPTISPSVVPLSSCLLSFPASGPFQILQIWWPKYWSFSFSICPSREYSGLISFRMDCLDIFAVQGTLKNLIQHHSSETSVL